MARHFPFSKNKKQSQCSPEIIPPFKIPPNPSKSFQALQIPKNFPHFSKSPKITRNFPKTPKPPPQPPQNNPPNSPEHPQTSPHPPQTHQNTSQILRNHPIRRISGQNLTPLSANSNTTFWKSGTSREPVGNQSGKSVHRPFGTFLVDFWPFLQGFSQKPPKQCEKTCIFSIFHGFVSNFKLPKARQFHLNSFTVSQHLLDPGRIWSCWARAKG